MIKSNAAQYFILEIITDSIPFLIIGKLLVKNIGIRG